METPKSAKANWGGKLWLLVVIAVVLTVLVVAVLIPRPLAYISPEATPAPWTAAPGLYTIPTIVVPSATPVP